MTTLTTQNGFRKVIGLVSYNCYMCERFLNMLQPLTRLTSNKVNFKWTDV